MAGLGARLTHGRAEAETTRLFLLLRREKTRWLTPAQVADVRKRYPPG